MKKHRIKLNGPVIQTRTQMETLVGDIAGLQLRLNQATAEMDQRITDVRKSFEGRLDDLSQAIVTKTQLAQVWADAHPEEFPANKKSIDFVHAVVGFRTGTPAVIQLKKSFTKKRILELLAKFAWSTKYIRQEPSIDKESILADRKTLTEDQLKSVGLKIDQAESFFIDLKATATETRIVEEAKAA